jgi:hypothetical protein
VGAVGRGLVDVLEEEEVTEAVLLPDWDWFAGCIVDVVVTTAVLVPVLNWRSGPRVTKVDTEVKVSTVCEGAGLPDPEDCCV